MIDQNYYSLHQGRRVDKRSTASHAGDLIDDLQVRDGPMGGKPRKQYKVILNF